MRRLHARYPFLDAARDAVETADVDLAELVASGDRAVIDRARERVEAALTEGTTGDPHRSTRVELLSYPVARVIVSLVDRPVLTRTYAQAEAAVAAERIEDDRSGPTTQLKSTSDDRLTLDRLLAEFDLREDVTAMETTETDAADATGTESRADYRVAVGAYLHLSVDARGDDWRLARRELADGAVPIAEDDLLTLLRRAIQDRVAAGLPLTVPDALAVHLADEVAAVRDALADLDLTTDVDAVVPSLFPPCMQALLERAREGEDLPAHSAFSLLAFFATIGMDADDAVALCDGGLHRDEIETRMAHLTDDSGPTPYPPPSCATMQAYGDCVNTDEVCETISHPLSYYETRLDDADDYEDWRETAAE